MAKMMQACPNYRSRNSGCIVCCHAEEHRHQYDCDYEGCNCPKCEEVEVETVKVKIVSSSLDTFWYADKIGEVFEVESLPLSEFGYRCVIDRKKYIKPEDCVVVVNEKKFTVEEFIAKFPETWENRPGGLKDAIKKAFSEDKDSEENEVFKLLKERLVFDDELVANAVTERTLCDACKGLKLLPRELSKRDERFLGFKENENSLCAVLSAPEIRTVNRWLKAKHEGKV